MAINYTYPVKGSPVAADEFLIIDSTDNSTKKVTASSVLSLTDAVATFTAASPLVNVGDAKDVSLTLSTVPVSKGGTGLTSVGTVGQVMTATAGGGLEFTGDKYGAPGSRRSPPVVHEHQVGLAVLHRGAEMHCARAIEGDIGTRTNLIVWMRSTQWRRHNGCAMCGQVEGLLGHSKPPKRAAAAAAAPPPADGGESACCMPS